MFEPIDGVTQLVQGQEFESIAIHFDHDHLTAGVDDPIDFAHVVFVPIGVVGP